MLFDKAKPGEKILVAVKLLHTVDNKTFVGTELKIDFAENRPNPEDLRLEILSAALLIPSISKNVDADTATLEKAIGAVDLAALDAKDQAKFDASLKQAQSTIEGLKPMLQQVTLHLTGNSHIDAAWLWPWTETVDVGQAHLRHRAAIDERISRLHLHPVGGAIQRLDRRQVSRR